MLAGGVTSEPLHAGVAAHAAALGFCPLRLARIAPWMQQHVASGRLAGLSVQVARQGQVVFRHDHGLRDLASGAPVQPDTIWRIYSMTKPLTTVAALMLYEEGAFQLDQPVADFLPAFGALRVWAGGDAPLSDTVAPVRPVTVHDLMTHCSGLVSADATGDTLARAYAAAEMDFRRADDSLASAVERLCRLPLRFQPGGRWHYGVSTDVLGRLVEVVSGRALGQFMRERILVPLGMRNTGFSVAPSQAARVATLYQRGPAGALQPVEGARAQVLTTPGGIERGGSGLYSTLDDYQRFADALLRRSRYDSGQLLGRKTFDLMVSNQMRGDLASMGQAHFSETTMEGIGFGLGVSVMLEPARARILGSPGEFAWGGMASTAFWVDPHEEMTVVLMTQLTPSSTYTLRRQLRVLSYSALV